MPHIDVLRAEARLAKRNPAELDTFRGLRLIQDTSETESQHLINALTWREVESDALPPKEGRYNLGIDLGGTSASSTADVVAAIGATALALKKEISIRQQAKLALAIERSEASCRAALTTVGHARLTNIGIASLVGRFYLQRQSSGHQIHIVCLCGYDLVHVS